MQKVAVIVAHSRFIIISITSERERTLPIGLPFPLLRRNTAHGYLPLVPPLTTPFPVLCTLENRQHIAHA